MKKAWLFLADRFNACQPRERVALFAALAAVLVGGFLLFVFNPAYARYQAAHASIRATQMGMRELEAQRLTLLVEAGQDPDAVARRQIAKLEEDNRQRRDQLLEVNEALVSAQDMTGILQQLLDTRKVTLVAVKTLPPEDMFGQARSTDPQAGLPDANGVPMSLYKHGLEVTISGTYAALVDYLWAVERLPRKIRVQEVDLHTKAYPVAEMKLTVYTMSMERAWLSM